MFCFIVWEILKWCTFQFPVSKKIAILDLVRQKFYNSKSFPTPTLPSLFCPQNSHGMWVKHYSIFCGCVEQQFAFSLRVHCLLSRMAFKPYKSSEISFQNSLFLPSLSWVLLMMQFLDENNLRSSNAVISMKGDFPDPFQ